MSNFKDPEIDSIIEGFQIFGSETNGLINPNELKEIMKTMNMEDKNPFLYNIIEKFCLDPNIQEKGGIEAEDFIFKLEEEIDDISSLEGLNNLFSIFFNPMTNTIPITTFPEVAKNVGEEENEEKLKNLITQSQLGDKELNFGQFKELINREKEFSNKYNNKFIYKKKTNNNNNNNNNNNKKQMIMYDNNKFDINKEINQEKNIIIDYNNIDSDGINDDFIYNDNLNEDNNYINDNDNNDNDNNDNDNDNDNNDNDNNDNDYDLNNFDNIKYNNEINNDINNFDNVNNIEKKKSNDIEKKRSILKKNSNSMNLKIKELELEEKEIEQLNNIEEEEDYKRSKTERLFYKKNKEYDLDDNLGELDFFVAKRQTKGRIEEDEDENDKETKTNNKVINQDNNKNKDEINDIKSNKRYHRRYREIKSNNHDKKEEKGNNKNNNVRSTFGYLKYGRINK